MSMLGDSGLIYSRLRGNDVDSLSIRDQGTVTVYSVQHVKVQSGGICDLSAGGRAYDVNVIDGKFIVGTGANAETVIAHGNASIIVNGLIKDLNLEGGVVTIAASGNVDGFDIQSGALMKLSGKSLGMGTVHAGGTLEVAANASFFHSLVLQIGAQLKVDGMGTEGATLRYV